MTSMRRASTREVIKEEGERAASAPTGTGRRTPVPWAAASGSRWRCWRWRTSLSSWIPPSSMWPCPRSAGACTCPRAACPGSSTPTCWPSAASCCSAAGWPTCWAAAACSSPAWPCSAWPPWPWPVSLRPAARCWWPPAPCRAWPPPRSRPPRCHWSPPRSPRATSATARWGSGERWPAGAPRPACCSAACSPPPWAGGRSCSSTCRSASAARWPRPG